MQKKFYITLAIIYSTLTALYGIISLVVLKDIKAFIIWIITIGSTCTASIAWIAVFFSKQYPKNKQNQIHRGDKYE